jgi:hypothetical protein
LLYPNAVSRFPTLADVRSSVTPYHLPLRTCDHDTFNDIRLLLQSAHVNEVACFYDRDPAVDQWYYQAYARDPPLATVGDDNNTFIAAVSKNPQQTVNSPVLIMKNGPVGGDWEGDKDIESESVVHTIWWYLASGNDVSQVFGEREFSRFLRHSL